MKHIRTGRIGEQTVRNHLKRKGYRFLEQNYRKKWGEIDLIMKHKGVVHFIEVKTVSHETKTANSVKNVSRENNPHAVPHETWRPEENVDKRKLQRLQRAIQTWLAEHEYAGRWQIDVVAVKLDANTYTGTLKIIDNVIPEP